MSGRRLLLFVMPLLALALALEARSAVGRLRASLVLGQVKAATLEADRLGRLSPRMLEANARLLRRVELLSPVEVALPIARGGQYLLLGRPRAAVRALTEALGIEPRGEVYAHLGRAFVALGDRERAAEAFRLAVVLEPAQHLELEGLLPPGAPRGGRKTNG